VDGLIGELGLPEQRISPPDSDDARAVLEARHPELSAAQQRLILDASGGNPLALVELYSVAEDPSSHLEPSTAQGLTSRLEQSFARRG
jgi:hypothetical protein